MVSRLLFPIFHFIIFIHFYIHSYISFIISFHKFVIPDIGFQAVRKMYTTYTHKQTRPKRIACIFGYNIRLALILLHATIRIFCIFYSKLKHSPNLFVVSYFMGENDVTKDLDKNNRKQRPVFIAF